MRFLIWTLRFVLFLVILGFAVKNTDPVLVRAWFGQQWQVPLVLVLLLFFGAGAAFGVLAALGQYMRQRRELIGLRRRLEAPADTADRQD